MDEYGRIEDSDFVIDRDRLERARLLARILRMNEAQAIGFVVLFKEASDLLGTLRISSQEAAAMAGWQGGADAFYSACLKTGILFPASDPVPTTPTPAPTTPPKALPPPSSWVYFIQSGDGGPIKIGWSEEPEKRIASLQTAHPEKLRLLAVTPGDASTEAGLHAEFSAARKTGEWFEPVPELLAHIRACRGGGL